MEELKEQRYEEIAEIPEKVSAQNTIDSDNDTPVSDGDKDGNFEELTASIERKASPTVIEDDYRDNAPGRPERKSGNLNISSAIKEKIPDDFNLEDIGAIDLQEAEKIANENILVLTEEDLIEGLDDFELVPLSDDDQKEELAAPKREITRKAPEKHVIKEKVKERVVKPETVKFEDSSRSADEYDVEISEAPGSAAKSESTAEISEGDIETADVINLNDLFDSDKASIKTSGTRTRSDLRRTEQPTSLSKSALRSSLDRQQRAAAGTEDERQEQVRMETLPDQFKALETSRRDVLFIDDSRVIKEKIDSNRIFEENELEKITSDIIEVIEGKTKLYREADVDEDKELVAHMLTGIAPVFEDLLLEFEDEYKYIDEEIDFIHTILTQDDYSDYIRYIDEYHGIKSKKEVSTAIDLVGLTRDEVGGVEEKLFSEEYKDVNLYEIFDFFKRDYSGPGRASIRKDCTYILPTAESLLPEEKISIESDISSGSALIFEEDIDDIRELFVKTAGAEKAQKVKVIDEVFDITDQVVIIDDELDIDRFAKQFPSKRPNDVKKLLKYLDGLFEKLPRETLKKFIDSEYFDLYIKVLTELGV
ncbi:MAG TPA: hypothetical protein P5346_00065 [Spirochaetota bacterium]|nr:hypothetical protein [Spirochaetota bacterium]HSA13107.1 hypothetical protein [Spirochaetota bacterium]